MVSIQSMNQPGKVANPGRGQLNGKNVFSMSPFAPWNLVSRDGFGRPIPRHPHILHTQAESSAYSRDSSRFPRRCPFSYRQPPSGQFRVNQASQLRTDGVPCRESAGTGPVVLKVVPVTGAAFSGFAMDQFLFVSLFPHPLLVLSGHV